MSIFPLSSHKKRGITPTLGEQYPLKKAKKRDTLPLLCVAFCLGYKRFRLLLAV